MKAVLGVTKSSLQEVASIYGSKRSNLLSLVRKSLPWRYCGAEEVQIKCRECYTVSQLSPTRFLLIVHLISILET